MDDDPYGFCNDLALAAVKVLDRAGLDAFEREVRSRFDKECPALSGGKRPVGLNPHFERDRRGEMLKAVFSQQRNVGKYLDLTERTDLTQADCEAIAVMFQAKRKPNDALHWVERGLGIEKRNALGGGASYRLDQMRRALLVKLGRGGEALDSAWAKFQARPSKFTYEELQRYVPKAERRAWHEKAMEAAQHGDLGALIGLWLSAKEIGRLAERLDRASDAELEDLSHYVSEPAAGRLAKTHPGVAARGSCGARGRARSRLFSIGRAAAGRAGQKRESDGRISIWLPRDGAGTNMCLENSGEGVFSRVFTGRGKLRMCVRGPYRAQEWQYWLPECYREEILEIEQAGEAGSWF